MQKQKGEGKYVVMHYFKLFITPLFLRALALKALDMRLSKPQEPTSDNSVIFDADEHK